MNGESRIPQIYYLSWENALLSAVFPAFYDRPEGEGYYDENSKQFVLVKGCVVASQVVASFKSIASRQKFIDEHCKTEKGQIILQHDVPVDSPSGASGFILGRPSNGWDDWKDADGNKLGNVVKRH